MMSEALELQRSRQKQLSAKMIECAMPLFDADGGWTGSARYPDPDERDRYRLAAILLAHGGDDELALAEALIMRTFGGRDDDRSLKSLEENIVDLLRAEVRDWNIFDSNIATTILVKHRDRFCEEVREKLERIARRNLSRFAGSAQADYIFHGANDNMPSKATCGLILGGELLGDERAVRDGLWRLGLLAEMLSRRGLCSEFASGTYMPITIQGIADVAEHARSRRARELAQAIETQLWADVICHYHPGSGKCAGPQTRAYLYNTLGHLDNLMLLLWVVSGQPPFADPVGDIVTVRPKQAVHGGNPFYCALEMLYGNVTCTFHVPAELLELMTRRTYPFRLVATAEQICGNVPDCGGRDCVSTAYQTADYSIASSDHGFLTGNQSEKIRICYRRSTEPRGFEDTGALFTRLLFDDEVPGQLATMPDGAKHEKSHLSDHALMRVLHHDDLALVVTRAHRHDSAGPLRLRRIRQCVIIPTHYHDCESAWIGEDRADDFSGSSRQPECVFIDLGRLYVALLPLPLTDLGRSDVVRLDRAGDYSIVSFVNYEGSGREFDGDALSEVFNGFVIRVSGPGESGSFEQFRAACAPQVVEDWWFVNNRRTRVVIEGRELLLNWSTPTDTVRCATVNGRPPPCERFAATGLRPEMLPLLSGPYVPSQEVLPLDDLNVSWYPHLHWQIGTRVTEPGHGRHAGKACG